jgi:hypothetical protein
MAANGTAADIWDNAGQVDSLRGDQALGLCQNRSANLLFFAIGDPGSMKEKHTVSSYFAKALLYQFSGRAVEAGRLLEQAGFVPDI